MADSSISDHIGRVGEDYFDAISNKARLLIGQIVPDRLGRDRVIEFELESMGSQSYDTRLPPIGCSVQIKTTLSPKDSVSLSLSVAERLAGDTRPAFVCIVRIDAADALVDLHLIHILDGNLERILKRLRKEYSKGSTDLNRKKISFKTSAGTKVEASPVALINALKEMIGPDMEAYAQRKVAQRRTLGFDKTSWLSANIAFDVETDEELIDGMLGLKPLQFSKFEMFEERFEIKLPYDPSHGETLRDGVFEVLAEPIDAAILRFENPKTKEHGELECEIISPGLPSLPIEKIKLLARTKLFDAVMGFNKFKLNGSKTLTETLILPVRSWIEFFRCWQIMSQPDFTVELLTKDRQSMFRGAAELSSGNEQNLAAEITTLECFYALRTEAGASDDPIDYPSIVEAYKDIRRVHAYFLAPSKVGDCTFKFVGDLPVEKDQLPVVFVSVLIVGPERYAYGLRFEMDVQSNSEEHSFRSTDMKALQIIRLDEDTDSMKGFADQLCKISGVEMRVVQDFVPIEEDIILGQTAKSALSKQIL